MEFACGSVVTEVVLQTGWKVIESEWIDVKIRFRAYMLPNEVLANL
jgi:hypothetical protein